MSDGDRAQKRRRWMAVGLVVSLTVNAFFLGVAATDFLRDRQRGHGGPRILAFELRWLAGHLPPEAMQRIQAAVDATRPGTERHVERLRELRRELGRLGAAPQLDRAAIDAQLAAIRAEFDQMLADVQKATIDTLVELPPEMRAKLAETDDRDNGPPPQPN